MEEIGAIDCVDVGEVEVVVLGVCNMGFVVVADPFVVGMPALFDVAMGSSDIDGPAGDTDVAAGGKLLLLLLGGLGGYLLTLGQLPLLLCRD